MNNKCPKNLIRLTASKSLAISLLAANETAHCKILHSESLALLWKE